MSTHISIDVSEEDWRSEDEEDEEPPGLCDPDDDEVATDSDEYQPTSDASGPATDDDSIDPDKPCAVCGGTDDKQMICEGCSRTFHKQCVGRRHMPRGPFTCVDCENYGAACSALKSASKLGQGRTTQVAKAAAAAALATRAHHTATLAKRVAAARAAKRAREAAAVDDSAAAAADAPARGPGRPRLTEEVRAQRRAQNEAHGVLACSITVVNKRADVVQELQDKFARWLATQAAVAVAMERGGTYGHLHLQACAKAYASTPQQVNRLIKGFMGDLLTPTHAVCVKRLTGRGLHTWHGIIGYVHKDSHLPHFRVLAFNISEEDVQVGRQEYLKYGAGSLKKRAALTPRNIFDKAVLFNELHCNAGPAGRFNFHQTLLQMLRTGKYYPAGWLCPWGGRGLSHERTLAQWRMMTEPATVQPDDICKVFFWAGDADEYTATGGRQLISMQPDENARCRRLVSTYFASEGDDIPAPPPQRSCAGGARRPQPGDDGGLGEALGYADNTLREEQRNGDDAEYWLTVQAKLRSMQDQPGPSKSPEAALRGESINALQELLIDNEAYDLDWDGE